MPTFESGATRFLETVFLKLAYLLIEAPFEYLRRLGLHDRQKPYEVFIPLENFSNPAIPRTNLQLEARTALVQDARGREHEFTLDEHGFACCTHETRGLDLQALDLQAIESEYLPEVQALIRRCISGVQRMCSFDWGVRKSMDRGEFAKKTVDLENGLDPLLPAVHPHVVQRRMGDEAAELLKGRFRIINVWRPPHIVKSWPLALRDAQTVKPDDLVPADIIRKRFVGETCFAAHSTDHRWYFLSHQREDEVVMSKIYDSDPNVQANCTNQYFGNLAACLHSSFRACLDEDEQTRESIEVRTLVFTDA
ncbi:hypothetical protein QBC46DRAFT_420466 [Diplogelasinospora grovesii]|uniref:Uncharacterized protein n=1 Tax=Diplogelasinospora grovesii TaxID=303347 RepID=A0AAN6N226_9PEZI|nr:hypothetical protein QBC46DRAFT_420466 [Diplogelasinospora grovesii]